MNKPDTRKMRSNFEQRWRERFEDFASEHDDDAGIAGWSKTGLKTRMHRFQTVWRAGRNNEIWLDAGCGAGTYARHMAAQGLRVVAIDYSIPTIQKAKLRDMHSGSCYLVGDVTHLPFRSNTFDGVISFGVTQALSGSGYLIQELISATKQGGEIWIDALNVWSLVNCWDRAKRKLVGKPPHVRYECPWKLREKLRRAGLTTVHVFWLPILPVQLQRLQWVFEKQWLISLFEWIPFIGAVLSHSFIVRGVRR